jgi:hypothetical protein
MIAQPNSILFIYKDYLLFAIDYIFGVYRLSRLKNRFID